MNVRFHRVLVVGTIIFASLVVNVASSSVVYQSDSGLVSSVLVGIFVGWISAQINLIAIWASMAPGSSIVRLPWAVLLMIGIWLSVLQPWDSGDRALLVAALITAQVMAQIPFRIASWARGYRVRFDSIDRETESRQFGIKSVLIGTGLVAVAMSLLRFSAPTELSLDIPQRKLMVTCVMLTPAFITNGIMTWPSVWLAFCSQARLLRIAFKIVPFLVLAAGIELAVMISILGPPGEGWFPVFALLVALNTTQCFVAFAVIRCLRKLGFRLTSRTDGSIPVQP